MFETVAGKTVRLLGALAVVAALAFGVREATASSRPAVSGGCVCQFPDHDACEQCCMSEAFCTTANICLC